MIKNTQQALNIANPTSFIKRASKFVTEWNSLTIPQIKNPTKIGVYT